MRYVNLQITQLPNYELHSKRSHWQTLVTGTRCPQKIPGVNSGRMAVRPKKLQGITADGRNLLQVQICLWRIADHLRVRRAAHMGMASLALDTWTNRPQSIKWVHAFMPVIPVDDELSFFSIGRYIGRSGHIFIIRTLPSAR